MTLKGNLSKITETSQVLGNGRVRLSAWVLPEFKLKLRDEALARNISIADLLDRILADYFKEMMNDGLESGSQKGC